MEGAGASEPPAARAARYLRAQLRHGSTAAFVFWGVVALLGARSAQRGGPEAHASTDRADDLQRGHQYFLVIFSVVGFLVMQVVTARKSCAKATSGARLRRERDAVGGFTSIWICLRRRRGRVCVNAYLITF